jgi:hypothetical protein
MYTYSTMKSLLPFLSVLIFMLLLAGTTQASTSVDISNNGEGSHTSVSVHSSTGGNYINGKEVSGSNGTAKTTVKVNGETLIDETTEGGQDVDVSVKKEGDNPPEVKYQVNKKEKSAEVKGSATVKDGVKEESEAKKTAREAKLQRLSERLTLHEDSLFARLEVVFSKLRELFSK